MEKKQEEITNTFATYNGELYIGGTITYGSDGNTPVGNIEKWNGTNWSAVGAWGLQLI